MEKQKISKLKLSGKMVAIPIEQKSILEQNVAKFFEIRFNMKPEHDPYYYEEWVHRFRDYTMKQLIKVMDNQSKQAWKQVTGITIPEE